MARYNPLIHNRQSIRLQGYDYSQHGLYFITLNCYRQQCLFGHILNKKLILNEAGRIAHKCWLEIPEHFPKARLHEFIVMPNHIHGIIEIKKTNHEENNESELCFDGSFDAIRNHFNSKITPSGQRHQFQYVIPRSIASILRGYKIGVTKWMRNNTDIHHVWQRNYYEHIIRNEISYFRITQYIRDNPSNWDSSK